jgi:hypothetical protein
MLAVLFEHASGNARRIGGQILAAFWLAKPKSLLATREPREPEENACPVQAIRFGNDLTLLALGCAVDTGLSSHIRHEFPSGKEPVVILGDLNGGPLAEDLQEAILYGVRALMKRVGK